MEDFAAVAGPVGLFIVIGWIISSVMSHRRRLRQTELQAELHGKLLDRFSSAAELASYLESDAGRRFTESIAVERGHPYGRILSSLRSGLLTGLAGIAFLALHPRLHDPGSAEAFLFLGVLMIFLGVGFLISAGLTLWLSKKWKLVNGDQLPRPGSAGVRSER